MANKVNTNNNDDFEQELAAYMQHMQDELSAAEQLIQDMQNEDNKKAPVMSKMDNGGFITWIANGAYGSWQSLHNFTSAVRKYDPNLSHITQDVADGKLDWLDANVLKALIAHAKQNGYDMKTALFNNTNFIKEYGKEFPTFCGYVQQLVDIDNKIKTDEAQLKAIDPNINLTLISQLNEMMAKTDALAGDGLLQDDLDRAVQQATVLFTDLCNLIMSSIQVDLAQAGMKKFGDSSDPRAAAAIMQFAGIAIQGEYQEQGTIQQIEDLVIDDETGWQNEKSQAQADLDKPSNAFIDFFTGGNPNAAKDHAQIRAADAMLSILGDIEKAISPLKEIDPGMQEFSIELDQLKKKFQAFLNGHGTLLQLKDAMVEALSILVGIIAVTQKDASMFDKEMNHGSMASSEMNMNDSLARETTIIAAKKYAALMGKLLTAAKYIGMGAIFLLNPGLGMAVMVAIDAALTASGVMDKLQAALTDKLGTIGGTAMLCGIEMVGTAGGAAAIDAIVEKVVENAVVAAASAVEVTMKEVVSKTVEEAVAGVVKGADEAAVKAATKAATTVTENAVKQAVETAERKVACVYLNKSVPEILVAIFKQDLQVTVEAAAKAAAEDAGKEIQVLAETAAKQGSAGVIGEEEIESIAKTSASRGVAEACKITEKAASKVDQMWLVGARTAGKKAAVRGTFAGLAAMGSTDFLTDVAAATQHKDKKDLSEGWQISMQVIQALMQFIGMLGETDVAPENIASTGVLNRFLLGAQAAQGALATVGDVGVAEANFTEAGAVKGIAKDQSVMDMMQFIMSQLRKDGQIQRDQYSKEMQQASKSNMALAMHFNDANQEVAQALAVLPV